MRVREGWKVAALSATVFVMVTANTMLFPVFPHMRRALGLDLRDISLLVLAVALPAALLSPLTGYLADLWGRRRVMIPSLLLYGIGGAMAGSFAVVLAHPFLPMLLARLLQGVGSAAPMYLAVVLAGDMFQDDGERSRSMGIIETANGLGKVLSPLIGGMLGLISWQAPFFFYPAISLPVAVGLWFAIDEPPTAGSGESPLQAAGVLWGLLSRSHMIALGAGFLAILSLYGVMFWVGEYVQESFAGSTLLQGMIMSVPVAALIATALAARWFLNYAGFRLILAAGQLVAGVCVGVLPFVAGGVLLWPAIVGLGVGAGMLLPAVDTVATAVTARGHRGIVTTTFGSLRCMGAAVAPYLVGALLPGGLIITFAPVATTTLFAGCLTLILAREEDLVPNGIPRGVSG